MTDAAGMLATYAAGVLAQPESRSHAASLKLGRSERAVIAGVPGLDEGLKGRLDIPSTGVKSFRFTLDELARICLALSEALLDVEGRDAVKRLAVAGKITDVLDQAVGELESPSKVKRVARQALDKGKGHRDEDQSEGRQGRGGLRSGSSLAPRGILADHLDGAVGSGFRRCRGRGVHPVR